MNHIDVPSELRDIGIRNTKNKLLILKTLKRLRKPVTANELHLLCTETAAMNITTVYRALQQFRNGGLLRELPGNAGTLLYEYSGTDATEHPHFRCERCDKLFCLDPLGFEAALFFSAMAKNHQVRRVDLLLSGLCEDCRGTENDTTT